MNKEIRFKYCVVASASSMFLAFGLYHVHALSGVTEGGSLGLNLLLEYWFGISPAITNLIVNVIGYLLGWKLLGKVFLFYSAVSAVSFSAFYRILEQFPPLWPQLYEMPLLAAVLGAIFVGVGTGMCIRIGGAICGDDALAMCAAHVTGLKIERIYLISDMVVLGLSLSYIPLQRIVYSVLTVILSGQIIGWIQRIDFHNRRFLRNRTRV